MIADGDDIDEDEVKMVFVRDDKRWCRVFFFFGGQGCFFFFTFFFAGDSHSFFLPRDSYFIVSHILPFHVLFSAREG